MAIFCIVKTNNKNFITCLGKQVFQGKIAVSCVRLSRAREMESDQALILLSELVVNGTFHHLTKPKSYLNTNHLQWNVWIRNKRASIIYWMKNNIARWIRKRLPLHFSQHDCCRRVVDLHRRLTLDKILSHLSLNIEIGRAAVEGVSGVNLRILKPLRCHQCRRRKVQSP